MNPFDSHCCLCGICFQNILHTGSCDHKRQNCVLKVTITSKLAKRTFKKGFHCSFSFETTLLIAFPSQGRESDVWNLLLVFSGFHLSCCSTVFVLAFSCQLYMHVRVSVVITEGQLTEFNRLCYKKF